MIRAEVLGQVETVEQAVNRLDEIVPRTDTWPTSFAKSVASYTTAIVSTAADFAFALIQDLGKQSEASLQRARSAQAQLADVASGLVPFIRATQGTGGSVTMAGLRTTVLAALRASIREWQNVEIADEGRSTFDAISNEYRQARERLTKKFWELGQGLMEIPAPAALPSVPPAASKGRALLGVVLVGVGVAGLAVWFGRRLG